MAMSLGSGNGKKARPKAMGEINTTPLMPGTVKPGIKKISRPIRISPNTKSRIANMVISRSRPNCKTRWTWTRSSIGSSCQTQFLWRTMPLVHQQLTGHDITPTGWRPSYCSIPTTVRCRRSDHRKRSSFSRHLSSGMWPGLCRGCSII